MDLLTSRKPGFPTFHLVARDNVARMAVLVGKVERKLLRGEGLLQVALGEEFPSPDSLVYFGQNI